MCQRDPQEFAGYDYEYDDVTEENADEPSGSGKAEKAAKGTYYSGKNFPGATDVVESELSDDADRGNIIANGEVI